MVEQNTAGSYSKQLPLKFHCLSILSTGVLFEPFSEENLFIIYGRKPSSHVGISEPFLKMIGVQL